MGMSDDEPWTDSDELGDESKHSKSDPLSKAKTIAGAQRGASDGQIAPDIPSLHIGSNTHENSLAAGADNGGVDSRQADADETPLPQQEQAGEDFSTFEHEDTTARAASEPVPEDIDKAPAGPPPGLDLRNSSSLSTSPTESPLRQANRSDADVGDPRIPAASANASDAEAEEGQPEDPKETKPDAPAEETAPPGSPARRATMI